MEAQAQKRKSLPNGGPGHAKIPKSKAVTGDFVDLDDTNMDSWGWKKVSLPAATDAPDEDFGGLFMLEEIEGVDIEYKPTDSGSGKSMKFKRRGSAAKDSVLTAKEEEEDDHTAVVLPDGTKFIDIDDFKDEDVKKTKRKAKREGEPMPANVQSVEKKRKRKRDMVDTGDGELEVSKYSEEADGTEAVSKPNDDLEAADVLQQESESGYEQWNSFKLSDTVMRGVRELGFKSPTPIQAKCLPVAIQWKRDIVGTAETGSGKTLAFGLPILEHLAKADSNQKRNKITGLILTPTRELAIQISDHLTNVGRHMKLKMAVVVGGMSIQKQQRQLENIPDIVVATPGRLWEIISTSDELLGQLRSVQFLVLDEADRMLEFGHYEELSSILNAISRRKAEGGEDESDSSLQGRQTFVFSATLAKVAFVNKDTGKSGKPREKGLSMRDLLKRVEFKDDKPIRIDLTKDKAVASGLKEFQVHCLPKDKDAYLYYSLLSFPGRTMVFVASIDAVTKVLSWLRLLDIPCFPLHGKLQQRQRLKNLDRFKTSKHAVLVATDVAARGLDIREVEHVIHYHVARNAQTYVHRSGRTARAGREGVSVSLVAPEEVKAFNGICQTLKKSGMPELAVDRLRLGDLQKRVTLAVGIEKAEHKLRKDSKDKSWIEKTAEEMDIELDDSLKSHDDEETSQRKRQQEQTKIKTMKAQLAELLASARS